MTLLLLGKEVFQKWKGMVNYVRKGKCDSQRGRRYLILELHGTPHPHFIKIKSV